MNFTSNAAWAAIIIVGGIIAFWWYRQKKSGKSTGFHKEEFVRNLTEEASQGRLDPVIGREEEVDRVIHIAARRSKNNPLLIGPPGVGKTAIVEGLAARIIQGNVPENLRGKQIFSLSLGELISGTSLRGEFEKRFQQLINRLEKDPGAAILFIDEIHMIDQAEGSEGGLDLADMVKPPLARGEISIIGATTWGEYEATLKKDPALDRRFQPVLIGEPTKEEALEIIRGIKDLYESHHSVKIDDEALKAAVNLSFKEIRGRYLPDKAIDVVDEAAAKVAIEASLGHKIPMALVDEASRKAAASKLAKEKQELGEEVGHLQELAKEFPDDTAITSAADRLEKHLEEMQEADTVTVEPVPIVTKKTIEEIVHAWGSYPETGEEPQK